MADYYIDATNGDNGNAGTSHAAAWQTLAKATGLSQGDNVYLLCDESWSSQRLNINWSGTVITNAVIGAYYMDGGVETVGVNGDGKPEISGVLDNVTPANNYPSVGGFLALVSIAGENITVQDLYIHNSGQYGIKVVSSMDNIIIQRNKIESTYIGSIYASYGNTNIQVLKNHCIDSNNKWIAQGQTGTWGGMIEMGGQYHNVYYNLLNGSYGEGIIPASDSEVKYNTVIDTQSVSIYVNLQENVEVAYNMVVGTNETTYGAYGDNTWHRGIGINNEYWGAIRDVTNIKIHHNIVINCKHGFRMDNTSTVYDIDDIYVYNNCWIDCKYGIDINNAGVSIDNNVYVRNNQIFAFHADTNYINEGGSTVTNWTFDHNHWYGKTAPTGIYSGTGDVTSDPGLETSTWRGLPITAITDYLFSDTFATAGSEDAGATLDSQYSYFISKDSFFNTTDPDPNSGDPITVSLTVPATPHIGPTNLSGVDPPPPTGGSGNDFSADSEVIAVYNFESGAITTDSQGSYTLTDQSDTGSVSVSTSDAPQDSGWADFERNDGGSNVATCFDQSALTSSFPNTFTICFFLEFESVGNNEQHLVSKYLASDGNRAFYLYKDNDDILKIGLSNAAGTTVPDPGYSHGTALSASTLYHVMFCYNNTTRFYKLRILDDNGDVIGTTMEGTHTSIIPMGSSSHFMIGMRHPVSEYRAFDGRMDEFVLCNVIKENDFQDAVFAQSYGAGSAPTIDTNIGIITDPDGTPAYDSAKTETWSTANDDHFIGLPLSEQLTVVQNPEAAQLSLIMDAGTVYASYYSQVLISGTYYLVFKYTTKAGDEASDLQTGAVATAIVLNGATFRNGDGQDLDTELPETDIGAVTVDVPEGVNNTTAALIMSII